MERGSVEINIGLTMFIPSQLSYTDFLTFTSILAALLGGAVAQSVERATRGEEV